MQCSRSRLGAGTQNQFAKWTDNAGTLGDSGITETAGGNVGIGTTTPGQLLQVNSAAGTNAALAFSIVARSMANGASPAPTTV
jgi:hypothetical protein